MTAFDILKQMKWRPLNEFFGKFKQPKDGKVLNKRLVTNASHFGYNYLVSVGLLLLIFVAVHPALLAVLAVIAGAFGYCLIVHNKTVVVGGTTLDPQQQAIALAVASALLLWLTGLLARTLVFATLSSALVLLHAALRPRTLKSRFTSSKLNLSAQLKGFGAGSDEEQDEGMEGGFNSTALSGGGGDDAQQSNAASRRREMTARRDEIVARHEARKADMAADKAEADKRAAFRPPQPKVPMMNPLSPAVTQQVLAQQASAVAQQARDGAAALGAKSTAALGKLQETLKTFQPASVAAAKKDATGKED